MTDLEWDTGWMRLIGARLPGAPESPLVMEEVAASRREDLDDLSGDAWLYAVMEAKKLEHWFPTSAKLRDYAITYRAPSNSRGLPPAILTEEQRELRLAEDRERMRESSRRGLAMVEEALRARGCEVRSQVVQSMPVSAEGRKEG